MRSIYKRPLLAIALPIGVGSALVVPVITSDNGYVAGFAFVPIFFLVVLAGVALFVGGLIVTGIKGRSGLWVALTGPLLLAGFMGTALIAKQLELGAYREQPMISFPPPIANKVLFKKDATHEEIERFWTHVIGFPTEGGGSRSLPGIESVARTGQENGHETVTFSFRAEATEEQKADVRESIHSYSPVFQYLENVPTDRNTIFDAPPDSNAVDNKPKKTVMSTTRSSPE